ncbi:MAG: TolC family protein [Steroidobacteraceae bacterium]
MPSACREIRRQPVSRQPGRRVGCGGTPRLAALGLAVGAAAMLGGCAVYHGLPLPAHADLVGQLSELRTRMPAVPGQAQRLIATEEPLAIDDVGMLAVLNDPDLRAERGTRDSARAGLLQASLLPNPSANLSYEALIGGVGTSAWAASLTEDVRSILTYHTRKKSARFQLEQVNADLLWQEWQVAQQARILAVDLYWGDLAASLAQRQLALLDQEAQAVQAATRSGALDLTALAPLLAAKASAAQTAASLGLAQLQGWQQLDALLGLQPQVRFAIAPPRLEPLPRNLQSLLAQLPTRRPDLIALRLGYRSADESVRGAIIGQFPAFALGGIWEDDNGNIRNAGPTASFDVPIFDRNQGQVAQARATRLLLHEQYQSRLDQAVGAAKGLLSQIQRLTGDAHQAERAAEAAEAQSKSAQQAYAQDNLDQRSLADFETTALQRRIEAFALERTLGEARITLTVDLGLGLPRTRIATPSGRL